MDPCVPSGVCPRCSGTAFTEHDCGADTWDDDCTWAAFSCDACGLWYSRWVHKWLIGVTSWRDEEDAAEFTPNAETPP